MICDEKLQNTEFLLLIAFIISFSEFNSTLRAWQSKLFFSFSSLVAGWLKNVEKFSCSANRRISG